MDYSRAVLNESYYHNGDRCDPTHGIEFNRREKRTPFLSFSQFSDDFKVCHFLVSQNQNKREQKQPNNPTDRAKSNQHNPTNQQQPSDHYRKQLLKATTTTKNDSISIFNPEYK